MTVREFREHPISIVLVTVAGTVGIYSALGGHLPRVLVMTSATIFGTWLGLSAWEKPRSR